MQLDHSGPRPAASKRSPERHPCVIGLVATGIRSAASHNPTYDLPKLTHFVPIDPSWKISGATATDANGTEQRIIKGAFIAVTALTAVAPGAATMADELEKHGFRVLAVADGPQSSIQIVGSSEQF